jgi:type VI protein secretion system component VasF
MVVNEREFPVVVEAYQPADNGDLFVAEQMVRNQSEVDLFSRRYAGYIIKARGIKENEFIKENNGHTRRTTVPRRGIPAWAILLLIVVVLVVVGFTTGWIQRTFELNL